MGHERLADDIAKHTETENFRKVWDAHVTPAVGFTSKKEPAAYDVQDPVKSSEPVMQAQLVKHSWHSWCRSPC